MHFFLYYVLPFIVVLGILIFFHEMGHFLIAKYFGVKVLKFSLGFGPKVLGKRIGETQYLISAVPFGGYVKMLGESDGDSEPLTAEDEKRSFSHQHVLKRIAIVAAGPLFNLFLALFIFCIFYLATGVQVMTSEIGEVRENSPAENAGLRKGDEVVSIDGAAVKSWSEIKDMVQRSSEKPLVVTVKRGEDFFTVEVVPEVSSTTNLFGEEIKSPLIGIVSAGKFIHVDLGPLGAIKEGFNRTWEVTKLTFLTILKLFQRVIPIKTLGGPLLIGQLTGQLAEENLAYLIPFMAVISINLGILNLLPVPILDGGFILFLLIELVLGKPLSIKRRELAQKVGLFLLILLMAVVFYNDVSRLLE